MLSRLRWMAPFTLLCLALVSAAAQAQTPYDPTNSLVAYWPGNGTYQDVIGGANGTPVGGVCYATDTPHNGLIPFVTAPQVVGVSPERGVFNFGGGRVFIPDTPALALTQSLAITAWIKPTAYPGSGSHGYILFRGDDRVGLDPYVFYINDNGTLGFDVSDDTNSVGMVTTAAAVPLNQWSYVTASLDDATGTLSIYINGTLAASGTTPIRPFATLSASQNPGLGIGNVESGNYNFPFLGEIGEVKVFNSAAPASSTPAEQMPNVSPRVVAVNGSTFTLTVVVDKFAPGAVVYWDGTPLSTTFLGGTPASSDLTAQVPSSMIATTGTNNVWIVDNSNITNIVPVSVVPYLPDPSLVAYWPGNGNDEDIVGGNDGTSFNDASFIDTALGGAFNFDGNGRIGIPDNLSLELTHSVAITAWIFPTAYPGWHSYILFRGDDRIGTDPYSLYINSDGTIGFDISDANNNNASATSTASVPLNTWSYVTGSLDDATGDLSVYINGSLAGSATTSLRPFGDLVPGSLPGLGIGNVQSGSYGNEFAFSGAIDELKLYSSAAPAALPPPTETISASVPSLFGAGPGPYNFVLNGTNFTPTAVAEWNGNPLTTVYVSPTQLNVQVDAGDVATPGTFDLWVTDNGTATNVLQVSVVTPPSITSLSPPGAVAGSGNTVLLVNGTNFSSQSVVYWNGQPCPPRRSSPRSCMR